MPIVSIARALNQPTTMIEPEWDLVIQPGPFEKAGGKVIAPLVEVMPAKAETDVLVVVSNYRPSGVHSWWQEVINELRDAGTDFTVLSYLPLSGVETVTGSGAEWVGKANVVVGAAGAGGLYEALWAGKPLVARAFNKEQHTRLAAAERAGEAIVPVEGSVSDAIKKARRMKTKGQRPNGTTKLATLLGGLT